MMIKKLCRICKDEKPLFDFYKSAKGKHGHGTTCKLCDTAYQKTRKEQKSVSNILNPAIFPDQGEIAFPDGIRAESARIAGKNLENMDE
jgi:hypothetical protein